MSLSTRLGYALGSLAAMTLVTGCSSGGQQVASLGAGNGASAQSARAGVGRGSPYATSLAPAQAANDRPGDPTKSWMNAPNTLTRLTYVSDFRQSNITVFGRNGVIQGEIKSVLNPQGMFVDSARNLWVANTGSSNVLVYPRGATSPSSTLSDTGFLPVDVTICPNGTVYVSNIFTAPSGPGNIEVYAGGSTSPTGVLTDSRVVKGLFLTCDAKNNVFWDFTGAGSVSFVVEFAGGKQSNETTLPIALGFPGGIKPDNAGNLLVNDQNSHTIAEYTEAGAPTGLSIASDPTADCVDIAVTRNSKVVGCAIFTFSAPPGGHTYTFPGGVSRKMYTNGLSQPLGIAFDPIQKGLGK
ncbi:MAG: hypothetical protein ABI346_06330 [Candidatus Baltobacteraceae bacterium]